MKKLSIMYLGTICSFVFILVVNQIAFGQNDGDWNRTPSGQFGGNDVLSTAKPTDKVGIGTTSPGAKLQVESATGDVIQRIRAGSNNTASLQLVEDNTPSGFSFDYHGDTNKLVINALGTGTRFPRVSILRSSGNVGIGTTNPAFPLSLGSKTGLTKLALFETGADNSYGLGVVPGAFRLHLNGSGARFAFFDGDTSDAKEIFTVFGSGVTQVKVLKITGGSDLAEPFEIAGAKSIKSGMVTSIDPEHPGQLLIANKAYDRTVAGIVSGANGLNPGLTLQQKGSAADGNHLVALTGRVYCWADTANGPIQPGDLLTTSDTPGHAMKVTDYAKAHGAIIGKSMGSLETGRGLLLTLVTLQ